MGQVSDISSSLSKKSRELHTLTFLQLDISTSLYPSPYPEWHRLADRIRLWTEQMEQTFAELNVMVEDFEAGKNTNPDAANCIEETNLYLEYLLSMRRSLDAGHSMCRLVYENDWPKDRAKFAFDEAYKKTFNFGNMPYRAARIGGLLRGMSKENADNALVQYAFLICPEKDEDFLTISGWSKNMLLLAQGKKVHL